MGDPGTETRPLLRTPWSRSDRPVPRVVLRPLQEFLQTQNAGGLLLVGAVLVALAWANSPWSGSYERLWHTQVTIRAGARAVDGDLRLLVNEGLMTLFFLVVGLEIKRELTIGELREWRAASLPVLAALGGMLAPALLFWAITAGTPAARGWGVPLATDIALALGVLTLAAAHAPPNLKPFLLTLAIVDDFGAIVVIALFYSNGVAVSELWPVVGVVVLIVVLQRIHVRSPAVYVVLGAAAWYQAYRSGVNPTIVGAALGLLTPAVAFHRPRAVSEEAHRTAHETADDPRPPDADAHWWLRLAGLSKEAVSPLTRVEHLLLPWSTFVILPVFALANAGVPLSFNALGGVFTARLGLGLVIGRLAGKVVGVWVASRVAVGAGIARLPADVSWRNLAGAATVAGVGFVVPFFVAEQAFSGNSVLEDQAKVAMLVASVIAGAAGYLVLRRWPSDPPSERPASAPPELGSS
jgi:Na+:H+ antiporter, NhaA family